MSRPAVMPAGTDRSAPRTVGDLADAARRALDPLLAAGDRVVLVGTGLANVGDCAIALATRRWLERTVGRWLELDRRTYGRGAAAAWLGPSGVVLLAGGGTLGDVWRSQEALRRRVLEDFPAHRVVQLPQTVHFESASARADAGAFYRRHPRLSLLARDAKSLALARDAWGLDAALVPDVAFTLDLERPAGPTRDALWLLRADQESVRSSSDGPSPGDAAPGAVDWPAPPTSWRRGLRRAIARTVGDGPSPARRRWLAALDAAHARRRVAQGCALLSTGAALVTDRLHAAVLAILLRVPVVLVPDRNGKLRAFHDTWLRGLDGVRWCDSADYARALLA